MSRARVAVALLAAAVATGCGTTVPHDQLGALLPAEQHAGLGLQSGGWEPAAAGVSGQTGSVTGDVAEVDAPGVAVAGPSEVTAAAPSTADAGSGVTVPGGKRRSEVRVGLVYNKGADAAAAALGFQGISFGDQKAMFETVISELNARGGVAGRRVVPVWVAQDSGDTRQRATQEQAWCETLTRDGKVDVAVIIVGYSEPFVACLAQARVPLIARWTGGSQPVYDRWHDVLYTLADPPLEAGVVSTATALHARGWLRQAKVGIVSYDAPDEARAERALIAQLRSLGVPVAARAAISNSSLDEATNEASAAVLKFRSESITHVLFVLPGGGALFFMTAAESQQYRPQYGLSSFDQPEALASLVPQGQLTGAAGEGWSPLIDVSYGAQPPANPARARCLQLHREQGRTFSDGVGEGFALGTCDVLWFLERAAARSPGAIDAPSLARGAAALGTEFGAALTLGTRFTARRHYGPALLRDTAFDAECGCFRYASTQLRPLR